MKVSSRSNRNTKSSSIVESMQKGISENEKQQALEFRRKNTNSHPLSSKEKH